jgi:hypothetical protein
VAVLAILIGACTSDPPPPAQGPPGGESLQGDLLLGLGGGVGSRFEIVSLPGQEGKPVEVPGVSNVQDAILGPDGEAYFLGIDENGPARLYRAPSTGAPDIEAEPIGPGLHLANRLLGVVGDLLIADTCQLSAPNLFGERDRRRGKVRALDLSAPDEWVEIAPGGCGAAMSPDGRWVAYAVTSGTGRRQVVDSVFRAPIDGSSAPEPMLDLEQIRKELKVLEIPEPVLFDMAWGNPGLAVEFGDEFGQFDHVAIVFVDGSGAATTVPLGNTFAAEMTWQPGGDLLAFTDCVNCFFFGRTQSQGEIRLFDSGTGRLRQVAVAPEFFNGLSWSPDGRYLVSRWRSGELLVVDTDGNEVGRIPIEAIPYAWGPP